MKGLIALLLLLSTSVFSQDFSFFIDTNEVFDLQEYALLPKSIKIDCNHNGWRVSRMRVHILNGRWPVAKIDVDTNVYKMRITADSTNRLFAKRRVLIEALAVKNDLGQVRMVDEFVSVNMDKCLGLREIPFASVHYNGTQINALDGVVVINSGGALSIKLLPQFNDWSMDSIRIVHVRGKRLVSISRFSMSNENLSKAKPGDRILIMRNIYASHWDRGYGYVEQFYVRSSEYVSDPIVQRSDMQCEL